MAVSLAVEVILVVALVDQPFVVALVSEAVVADQEVLVFPFHQADSLVENLEAYDLADLALAVPVVPD